MEIRCKATLLFQDDTEARGVGDYVTGIAEAFIGGKLDWDGFQKHLIDNCVRNTTGSRHNSYGEDFMHHMSILRDASSPEQMLRQLMLWMPSPEPVAALSSVPAGLPSRASAGGQIPSDPGDHGK